MCSKNFFRRMIPFFATFALGIFIASFFGPIGRSGFGGRRARHFQEDQQIRLERDQLRQEIMMLRNEMDDRRMNSSDWDHPELMEGPRSVDAPMPPHSPIRPSAPQAGR